MLVPKPEDRGTIEELARDEWLNSCVMTNEELGAEMHGRKVRVDEAKTKEEEKKRQDEMCANRAKGLNSEGARRSAKNLMEEELVKVEEFDKGDIGRGCRRVYLGGGVRLKGGEGGVIEEYLRGIGYIFEQCGIVVKSIKKGKVKGILVEKGSRICVTGKIVKDDKNVLFVELLRGGGSTLRFSSVVKKIKEVASVAAGKVSGGEEVTESEGLIDDMI